MLPQVIVTHNLALFTITLKVDVTVRTIGESSEAHTGLGVEVVESKDKHYVMLSKLEGLIENSNHFAKTVVDVLQRCYDKWVECFAYELNWTNDRFAISPDLYDQLPSSLLEFIEIDDEFLFLSAKGVKRFTETVPLYKIQMF